MSDTITNTDYRLQILHHEEVFSDRTTALKYIVRNVYHQLLAGEPAVFFYGDEDEPNAILAIGDGNSYAALIDNGQIKESIDVLSEITKSSETSVADAITLIQGIISSTGVTYDTNKTSDAITYEPDATDSVIGSTTSIAEAVSALSSYIQAKYAELSIVHKDSESISFETEESGDTIAYTPSVNISEYGSTDSNTVNDNIIGIKSDGLYVAVDMSYDDSTKTLTFVTSGVDSDGNFVDDAKVKTFELGEHVEYTAENTDNTVVVTIDNDTHVVSANVRISEEEYNLLETKEGGYLYAEAKAKSIKFKNGTVYSALNDVQSAISTLEETASTLQENITTLEDTDWITGDETDTLTITSEKKDSGVYKISGDVRLGSNNSIITSNGGLEVNMTFKSDLTNNQLIITLGDTTYTLDYPALDIISAAYYDTDTEKLVLLFNNGSEVQVSLSQLLITYTFSNSTSSPIHFDTETSGTATTVSATLLLASTDNMLDIDSNGYLIAPLSTVTNAVAEETERATAAEELLTANLSDEIDRAKTTEGELAHSIDTLTSSIDTEVTRAENAEDTLTTLIETYKSSADDVHDSLQSSIDTLNSTVSTLENSISTNTNNISSLTSSVETLNGDESTVGSVAYLIKAETTAREVADADIVKSSEEGDANLQEQIDSISSSIESISTSISSLQENTSYTAGDGISISDNVVSVNINTSETYLKADSSGLKTDGIDDAIANAVNALAADVYTRTEIDNAGYLVSDDIANLATQEALENEVERATTAEETNAAAISALDTRLTAAESDIDDLQAEVTRQNLIVEETNTVKLSKDKEDDGTTLSADVKVNADVSGNILQYNGNGMYATVELTYDDSTNTLTFTTGANGSVDIPLASGTLLQSASYDTDSNVIELVFVTGDTTNTITIPATDLVQYIEVVNTSDNPIILSKTETDGTVYLSATVNISTASTNGLLNDNGTLYVSNFATELYGLWDDETVSLQTIITRLKSYTDQVDGIVSDIEELQTNVTSLQNSVSNIEEDIDDLEEQVATNTANITTNSANIATLEGTVTAMSATITEISNSVATVNERLSSVEESLEESISDLSEKVSSIEEDVDELETALATTNGSVTTLTTQMTVLSTTVNNAVSEMEEFKTEIETQLSTLESSLSDSDDNITELQTSVNSLTESVSDIYDTLDNLVDFGTY